MCRRLISETGLSDVYGVLENGHYTPDEMEMAADHNPGFNPPERFR